LTDNKWQLKGEGHSVDNHAEEHALLSRAACGDKSAFEALYRQTSAQVYGMCLRLTSDPVAAEILAQDTFVKAWFAIGGFRNQGSVAGWLKRIAVNLYRDRFREQSRQMKMLEKAALEKEHLAAPRSGVLDLLTAVDLERCIARLPEGGRCIYVLHDIEGYTHPEVANMLGLAVGTVKSQLHRARLLLRQMLKEGKDKAHGTG
jgi:RNA polymerase sigma-70 factor, ECF subfamily